jgi:hypothetical protein
MEPETPAALVDEAAPVVEEKLVKVVKKPSATKSKIVGAKAKVAAPAEKAAAPTVAKLAAGRKPPTVREAMTPKKVGEDIAKETAKEVADNLGDGEQSWFVRFPTGRVIHEPEHVQTLLSVETKHIASLLTKWAWVTVRDPYLTRFPDGVVGVLVEWPNDIAFLSRPESTGENGTRIYGTVGLEGYDNDRVAHSTSQEHEDFSRKIHMFEEQMK